MEHKHTLSGDRAVATDLAAPSFEGQKRIQVNGTPSWGLDERLVPNQIQDDSGGRKIFENHISRYETAGHFVSGKRVLDIASGSGYGSQMLKLAGASAVVGVDVFPEAVLYAKEHYQEPGVDFICADAEQFEWSEKFDVIVSFETIEHLRNPDKFLERLRNLLVPGGDLLLSVPLGETRHFDPYHIHAFSQKDVFALLKKSGFLVELFRCDELFLTRSELLHGMNVYPQTKPPLRELLFTSRGRRIVSDLVFRGGFYIPQLLVYCTPSSSFK